jgi:hypothetical protein
VMPAVEIGGDERPALSRYRTLARIARRDGSELRVELIGETGVDVRLWEPRASDGQLCASKRGLRLSAGEALQLQSGLDEALKRIETRRLGRVRGGHGQ